MKKRIKKTTEKYVTIPIFEKSMVSIAKSFSRMDERFDKFEKILYQHEKIFTVILKEMQVFTEETREYRKAMASLMHTDIRREREIEELKLRVDRLEMRIK